MTHRTHVGKRSNSRGMVTVELALASLVVVAVLAVGLTLLRVVSVQSQLQDAAAEVARQVARGDDEAARQVRSHLPPEVHVEVSRQGDATAVRAHITLQVPVIQRGLPMEAIVLVRREPGQ